MATKQLQIRNKLVMQVPQVTLNYLNMRGGLDSAIDNSEMIDGAKWNQKDSSSYKSLQNVTLPQTDFE